MKKLAIFFIVVAGVLWGTSAVFVNVLSPYGVSSLQMTFVRAIVSTASLFLFLFFKCKKAFKVKGKELALFSLGGLSFFATASCYYISMQMTSVSTAVILMYCAPVLVMIYSVTFLGEKLTLPKALSVFAMLVGCALVSGIIGGIKFNIPGIIFGIMSGVAYSAYNILTKIQMKNGSDPLSSTFYCFLTATVFSSMVSRVWELPKIVAPAPLSILTLLLGLGLCTCVIPYFLYTIALKNLPVGTAASLGIIEPMAATIFSVICFGEVIGIAAWIGIFLICGAVVLLSQCQE